MRTRGSDGVVKVNYETIELSSSSVHTAVAGRDFERASGEIKFEHQQTSKEVTIRIFKKEIADEEFSDLKFGLKLSNI